MVGLAPSVGRGHSKDGALAKESLVWDAMT